MERGRPSQVNAFPHLPALTLPRRALQNFRKRSSYNILPTCAVKFRLCNNIKKSSSISVFSLILCKTFFCEKHRAAKNGHCPKFSQREGSGLQSLRVGTFKNTQVNGKFILSRGLIAMSRSFNPKMITICIINCSVPVLNCRHEGVYFTSAISPIIPSLPRSCRVPLLPFSKIDECFCPGVIRAKPWPIWVAGGPAVVAHACTEPISPLTGVLVRRRGSR